jgi:hypothetical protein
MLERTAYHSLTHKPRKRGASKVQGSINSNHLRQTKNIRIAAENLGSNCPKEQTIAI